MAIQLETTDASVNPLDSVEEILVSNNWAFNRMTDDELMVQIAGKGCDYRLFFIWQEDMNAMQFCCQYDMVIDKNNLEAASAALMKMNENLWMGHFDIPSETYAPSFRHTCLMRGMMGPSCTEYVEDLVDISLAQCERFYAVFYLLANAANTDDRSLALALMDTAGES